MEKKPLFAQASVVVGLAILCNALWGSAIPFINLGYALFDIPSGATASQILFAGCRFFLSGLITILFASAAKKSLVCPARKNVHMVIKLGMLQTVAQYVLFYMGVARTASVNSAIIQGVSAFVTILIASYVFHTEKMNRLKWIGGALGVAGVVVMNLGGGISGGMKFTGEGFLLLSMFAYAFSSGAIKIFSRSENPVALSGWQFMFGGLVMAIAGFAMGGRLTPGGWGAIAVLLYLSALSAVAYTLWSVLLKYNPVSRIAPYMFLQPIFGVVLSLAFYGGELGSLPKYGAALVLVCLSIMTIAKGQHQK